MIDTKQRPIRVLQVIGAMNLGGAESMIMNLYRKIDRTKVQFDFLVQSADRCAFDDEIELLGGHVYRIKRFKGYNGVSFYKEASKFIKEHEEIQIIHGHIGSSAALYLSAAKKEGIYTIAHSHSADIIRNIHDIAYKFFSYPTRYIADALFGCSTEAGIARYGKRTVKKANYANFHNAIDLSVFLYDKELRVKTRKELHIDDEIVLAAIGRVTPQKNPQFIFRVFSDAIKKYDDVTCLWIGTGDKYDEYVAKVKAAGISDRLIMTGERTDIPRILQAIDGLILPSLWEGLPVVAVEAQTAGAACLLSNTISREAEISGLVEWESLNSQPSVWAERIVSLAKQNRKIRQSPINDIQKNGYDIDTTAKWLCEFYLEKAGSR